MTQGSVVFGKCSLVSESSMQQHSCPPPLTCPSSSQPLSCTPREFGVVEWPGWASHANVTSHALREWRGKVRLIDFKEGQLFVSPLNLIVRGMCSLFSPPPSTSLLHLLFLRCTTNTNMLCGWLVFLYNCRQKYQSTLLWIHCDVEEMDRSHCVLCKDTLPK